MEFFSSDLGVAIAWICTVLSFLFGCKKNEEVKKLKLQITNTNLVQKSQNKTKNTAQDLDQSSTKVKQVGEKNVYANKVTGGIKIDM
ncbi:hypothetical protein [Vibrio cortegadensis]|uniref:Lipoprotein n=1 Tax=Vibrio cortegadensis TaxID=1328770 RepID=A0ABV4M8H1_9VIBR